MAGNLVFSTKIETTDGISRVNSLHIDMVETPFGELEDTVSMGFANTVQDSTDNAVRYTLLEVEEYQSFASAVVSMAQGLVINMIALPLAVIAALVWSIVSKYAAEALHKRKIMGAFQKYVAPQVVEEIAKNQDYQLKLGGEKRHIAVLFVDIRGFTPLSEDLQPEEVVEILNEYLGLVTDAIFKNGGTLDKFIGDAAMAVFNAPFDSDDYIYKAVCAAKDIAAGSERIAATFLERFGKKVSYGIGVNCGYAVVGNIGSEFRMDYTAIGDTVNTAARLESNAKAGQILISESVYEPLKERLKVTEMGEIPLKGKSQGVMVYSLAWNDDTPETDSKTFEQREGQ